MTLWPWSYSSMLWLTQTCYTTAEAKTSVKKSCRTLWKFKTFFFYWNVCLLLHCMIFNTAHSLCWHYSLTVLFSTYNCNVWSVNRSQRDLRVFTRRFINHLRTSLAKYYWLDVERTAPWSYRTLYCDRLVQCVAVTSSSAHMHMSLCAVSNIINYKVQCI